MRINVLFVFAFYCIVSSPHIYNHIFVQSPALLLIQTHAFYYHFLCLL